MPNNVFTITISATDRATATIRKINDSMSKVTRPFEEVGKSFKSLGREIGIDKIGKNLSKIGATARTAARGVGSIVAPLAGISGIATVAGIIHLADSWGTLGRSITYASQNIGVSTTQLQEFQGAARMAGLSGDTMTQSLQGLGNTMEDALYGRNQQALMLFNRLGVGIKRTGTGAMDVTGEYDALGKAIYKLKTPQQQWLAASQFGLTALLPLIRKYHGDMKKARADAEKQGIVMSPAQLKSAEEFAGALSKMSLSAKVLGYNVGNALIPALKPLTNELSTWIDRNRDLISTDIGDWVRDFAKWIESVNWKKIGGDIHTFIEDIDKVVNALGGVKGILIEIAAYKSLSIFGNVAASLTRIGALTKAMIGLRGTARGAAEAEAAAAAGGIPGKAWGPAAAEKGAGLLSKFGWLGALVRGALWAPRPAESPQQFRAHVKAEGLDEPGKESYWQKWADVFHWRTQSPAVISPHPLAKPTRGIRNNNPGNIIYGDFARRMGATGEDSGSFAIFPRAQLGIDAIGANLRSYGRKGFNTPFAIAHHWSTTDQDAYTKRLASQVGGDPNKQLDMSDPQVIAALSRGIITQENGSDPYGRASEGPYTAKAAALPVVAGKLHLDVQVTGPAGTKVKATPSDNTTARVVHTTVGATA